MKKLLNIFLFFISISLCLKTYSQGSTWDLQITSDIPATFTMYAVSIPFEGLNRPLFIFTDWKQINIAKLKRWY